MNTKELNHLIKTHIMPQKPMPEQAKNYIVVLRQTSFIYDALAHLTIKMSHPAQRPNVPSSKAEPILLTYGSNVRQFNKVQKVMIPAGKLTDYNRTQDELQLVNRVFHVFEKHMTGKPSSARHLIKSALHYATKTLHTPFGKDITALYLSMLPRNKQVADTFTSADTDSLFAGILNKYNDCQWLDQFLDALRDSWDRKRIDIDTYYEIKQRANGQCDKDKARLNQSLRSFSDYTKVSKSLNTNPYLIIFYNKAITLAQLRDKMYTHLSNMGGDVNSNPGIDRALQANICNTLLQDIRTATVDFTSGNNSNTKELNVLCNTIDKLLRLWIKVIRYSLTTRKYDHYNYYVGR